MWSFDPAEIRLPPGADVDLYLSALDVTHGLYIEGTDVNLMAVPGSVNAARFRVGEQGEYAVICHEYCGLAHDRMMGRLIVGEAAPTAAPAAQPAPPPSERSDGATLFSDLACDACHTVDGSDDIGPSLKGLFGSERRFTDGSSVRADAAYIEESIRDPGARIVEGFDDLMPGDPISDEDLRVLVAYIKGLR
jgi:cytochrome c oxidase subunit 2